MTPEEDDDLRAVVPINDQLSIPEAEIGFRFSRSSGPGGQHVQRTDTRVELLFDVAQSPSLTEMQRERIMQRLASHIDGGGVLRIVSSVTRSQLDNRAAAVRRFQGLLAMALRHEKRRVATKPSVAARERRLTEKRVRSRHKELRRRVGDDSD